MNLSVIDPLVNGFEVMRWSSNMVRVIKEESG